MTLYTTVARARVAATGAFFIALVTILGFSAYAWVPGLLLLSFLIVGLALAEHELGKAPREVTRHDQAQLRATQEELSQALREYLQGQVNDLAAPEWMHVWHMSPEWLGEVKLAMKGDDALRVTHPSKFAPWKTVRLFGFLVAVSEHWGVPELIPMWKSVS